MTASRIAGRQSQDGTVIILPPLASGWKWMKVGDVGEVKLGRQRSPEHHDGKHMRPYLRVANVYEDRIDLDDVMHMNFTPTEFETFQLRRGDVLLNEGQSLEWVGRPAMFRDEVPGACFQNTLIRFRAHPFIDSGFALFVFRYYLHSRRFQKIAKWTTNIAHLGVQRLAEIEFPVPPLQEQRRIVAKIEELFSDLDAGVAALQRVRANLKRYRAAVLKAAVEGRLTEEWRTQHPATEPAAKLLERILAERRAKWEEDQLRKFKEAGKTPPKGWKEKYRNGLSRARVFDTLLPDAWTVASVDQLCPVFVDCAHRTPKYSTDGVPALRPRDVVDGILRLESAAQVSDSEFAIQTVRRVPKPGDIIYSRELSCGWGVLVPRDTQLCMSQGMVLFRPSADILDRFLLLVVNGPVGREQSMAGATGSAHPHINLDTIRGLTVPLPPLAEQAEIVAEVDRRLSIADAAGTQVEHALQHAARLRQSILKRAFEGRLVPQDPTDEPAATLLERVESTPAGARPKRRAPRPNNKRRAART